MILFFKYVGMFCVYRDNIKILHYETSSLDGMHLFVMLSQKNFSELHFFFLKFIVQSSVSPRENHLIQILLIYSTLYDDEMNFQLNSSVKEAVAFTLGCYRDNCKFSNLNSKQDVRIFSSGTSPKNIINQ